MKRPLGKYSVYAGLAPFLILFVSTIFQAFGQPVLPLAIVVATAIILQALIPLVSITAVTLGILAVMRNDKLGWVGIALGGIQVLFMVAVIVMLVGR